jgi:hypothetical protein
MIAKHYLRRIARRIKRTRPPTRRERLELNPAITCAEYLRDYRPELKPLFPFLVGERGPDAWLAIKPTLPEGEGWEGIEIKSTPWRIMPEGVARLMLPVEDQGQAEHIERVTAGLQRDMIERAERTFYSAFGLRPELVNCRCIISTHGD